MMRATSSVPAAPAAPAPLAVKWAFVPVLDEAAAEAVAARFFEEITQAVAERGHDATDSAVFAPLWLRRQAAYMAGALLERLKSAGPKGEVEAVFAEVVGAFKKPAGEPGALEGNVDKFIEWAHGLGHYEEVMPWWGLPQVCPWGE